MIRTDLPPLPRRMKKLPMDERGFPVPFFVAWVDGKPDFRVVDTDRFVHCVKRDACWLCGEVLGSVRAMLIGPMCIINRTTSEPPGHFDCEEFAACACPFLTRPLAKRNERDLPEGHVEAAGHGLRRNPGVTAMWITTRPGYKMHRVKPVPEQGIAGGYLFQISDPVEVRWFAQGRRATRQECVASIESGLPLLLGAEASDPEAVAEVSRRYDDAKRFLPTEDRPHPYVLTYAPDWTRSEISEAVDGGMGI